MQCNTLIAGTFGRTCGVTSVGCTKLRCRLRYAAREPSKHHAQTCAAMILRPRIVFVYPMTPGLEHIVLPVVRIVTKSNKRRGKGLTLKCHVLLPRGFLQTGDTA